MTKLTVGKLVTAWTIEPTYDRGYHVPGSREVVKLIAMTDKQVTIQTLDGLMKVLPKTSVIPLPDHFAEAI
jgi:hypothetical protein